MLIVLKSLKSSSTGIICIGLIDHAYIIAITIPIAYVSQRTKLSFEIWKVN